MITDPHGFLIPSNGGIYTGKYLEEEEEEEEEALFWIP